MENFLTELQNQSVVAENLARKMESGEAYMEELKLYLPTLNQTIVSLFEIMQNPESQLECSQNFIVQVLNDIIYGIEHEDTVCLTDVLRYGLIEIFNYVTEELQGEG